MDCGVDNEDEEVVKENMSCTADSKVDNQHGEKNVSVDCEDSMEGVEYSKMDQNSDEVHELNRETKLDTSFNVRNG